MEVKQGYKTTEFWLTILAGVVSGLVAYDVIPTGGAWEKTIGIVTIVLLALGYQVGRSYVKTNGK